MTADRDFVVLFCVDLLTLCDALGVTDLDDRAFDAKRLAEHVAVLIHVLESKDDDDAATQVAQTVRKISAHYDAELEAVGERERVANNKLFQAEQRVARVHFFPFCAFYVRFVDWSISIFFRPPQLESVLERTAAENSQLRERIDDLQLANSAMKEQMSELKSFFNDEHERSVTQQRQDAQKLRGLEQANADLLQNLIDLKTLWAEEQTEKK